MAAPRADLVPDVDLAAEPGCPCEDFAPSCRHTEYPDADVCPDCGARRDCPIHGAGDHEPDFERDPGPDDRGRLHPWTSDRPV